jgi:hypothetical protein
MRGARAPPASFSAATAAAKGWDELERAACTGAPEATAASLVFALKPA